MAALPYMQLYVADYLADTQHLTTEEHGAYLLLLFNYWQTGRPLRKDRLSFVARMFNERWPSVEKALKEFFHDDGENWVHFRVEADLASVNSKSKTNSAAGKASAKARSEKKAEATALAALALATNVSTKRQRNVNHTDTDTDTDTDTGKSKTLGADAPAQKKTTSLGVDFLTGQGVDPQHAADWLKARKVPLTQTAWVAIEREAEKAGITSAMAVQLSAENTWRGFKAEWYANTRGSNGHQEGQGQRVDNSAVGRVKRAIAQGQAREAQPETVRHAKPQDGGDLRAPLDGEFWRED